MHLICGKDKYKLNKTYSFNITESFNYIKKNY